MRRMKKATILKTWGIHALHHGWTYDEVTAMISKMSQKDVPEILAWTKAQRERNWAKVS